MNPKRSIREIKISRGEAVPWLWLEDGEDEAGDSVRGNGAAGVVLVRDYNNGGPAVFIPPVMIAAPELSAALKVILFTPAISAFLAANDPQALAQAGLAIASAAQEPK